MAPLLSRPGVHDLDQVLSVLREWQSDAPPGQLHPGDIGWHWRFGAEATAAAVCTWSRDRRIRHRGRGHGRAISLAAAAALRAMGSSSAVVCTQSANVAAVATYRADGFETIAQVSDLHRAG